MRVIPLRTQVFVVLETPAETPSAAGIAIVRTQVEPSVFARVLAVGPEVREVEVGERVVVSRLQGIVLDDGVLMPESAVLAHADDADTEAEPNPIERAQGRIEAIGTGDT